MASVPAAEGWSGGRVAVFAGVLFGLAGLVHRRRQWQRWMKTARMAQAVAFLAIVAGLAGCGSSHHKPAGVTSTITATAGSLSHAVTFSLTV